MVLQPAALRAQLAALGKWIPDGEVPVVAFRGDYAWNAEETLQVENRTWQVQTCRSSLEIREALAFRESGAPPLVILTSVSHNEIGADVLARLLKRRLLDLDTWEPVLRAFGAQRLDARLAREAWLADVLLSGMPPDGYPKVASGTLDAATAWRVAFGHLLGVRCDAVDAAAVLEWTLDSSFLARWKTLPDAHRTAIRRWVGNTAGAAADLAMAMVANGHGADALALATVAKVLFRDGVPTAARAAAGVRLERFAGTEVLSPSTGSSLGRSAETVLARLAARDARRLSLILNRADELLVDLSAAEEATFSPWSPLGYRQRLDRFAASLAEALRADDPGLGLTAAAGALDDLVTHEGARANADQLVRARQALRLARYARLHDDAYASLRQAVMAYVGDHGWADIARPVLYASETHSAFGAVCETIANQSLARRERFTESFAALARSWFDTPSSSGDLVLIEDVLRLVVGPLAERTPVLLLVVDGMSVSVARALADSVGSRGWLSLAPRTGAASTTIGIAALPSTTEVCRTSLLCGAPRRGGSPDEARGFSANADLLARCRRGKAPRLFHKADLGAGPMLSAEVAAALGDADLRIVGAVVNAVDDHLLKDDMVRPVWSLEYVPVLAALFDAARAAGRSVVMVSDHGHVLDLKISQRGVPAAADRYRPVGPPAGDGEVTVSGSRLLSESKSLVVAASERVRYGNRKNGYHGGVSPQEIVIPVVVFCPDGRVPDGYQEATLTPPEWWNLDARVGVVAAPTPSPSKETGLPLFDQPAAPVPSVVPVAEEPWIAVLLGSEVFAQQRLRAARAGVSDGRVRLLLGAIASRGGKMTLSALAERLSMPTGRVSSLVAASGQLLNFDGYQSLFLDADDVVLDVELVKVQFQLH